MSELFTPIPHRSTLTRREWLERIGELRVRMHTTRRHWKYAVTADSNIPGWVGEYPINLGMGVAMDYQFPHALRTQEMLSVYRVNVQIVPFLYAQQLAEDYWNWVCQVNAPKKQPEIYHQIQQPRHRFIARGFTA